MYVMPNRAIPVSLLGLLLAALVHFAPLSFAEPSSEGPLALYASIPPQGYLLERIGGARVSVGILLTPGRDPHTFEPMPRQLTEISRAAAFFTIGLPFEETIMSKLSSSAAKLRIVDMTEGIVRIPASEHEHHHSHQPGETCDHGADGSDPHVWLSPVILRVLAANTAKALEQMDPEQAQQYQDNLASLLMELDSLHERIQKALEPYRGRAFYVFHPAFGYFAQAYGLKQEAVEMQGREPTPRRLAALIKKAKDEKVRIIFTQPQFDRRSAQTIADAIGGVVMPMDPLEKNLMHNLEAMATVLEKAFSDIQDGKEGLSH